MASEESVEQQRAKLERLKAVRRGHRGVLTKLTREMEEILASPELSSEGTSRLKVIHEQLEGKMKVFSNLDSEIVGLCVLDDIEREIDESEATTAKLIECCHRDTLPGTCHSLWIHYFTLRRKYFYEAKVAKAEFTKISR